MQMHMFSDMVTDPENVRLRGQELCEYFQTVVSDEGAITHPITARHLTFDGEVVSVCPRCLSLYTYLCLCLCLGLLSDQLRNVNKSVVLLRVQVHELRLERLAAAQIAEEARIREQRRTEDGRSHCRLVSDFCSQAMFSHQHSVGATHCVSRAAEASVRLAQYQQQAQTQAQQRPPMQQQQTRSMRR